MLVNQHLHRLLDRGQLAGQGSDGAGNELFDLDWCHAGLLLVGLKGNHDLAASTQPVAQFALPSRWREIWPKAVGEQSGHECKHPRVDIVGLGQLTGGAGESTGLSRVDTGDPEAGIATGFK